MQVTLELLGGAALLRPGRAALRLERKSAALPNFQVVDGALRDVYSVP